MRAGRGQAYVGDAFANNWGGDATSTGCSSDVGRADGLFHTFFYYDVNPEMREAANWARHHDLDPTQIDTSMVGDYGNGVDVVVYQDDYNNGSFPCGYDWHPSSGRDLIGLTLCESISYGECGQHLVYFDTSWTAGAGTWSRQALACHEFGHTVSLTHYDPQCMNQDMPTGYIYPYYTNHENYLINSHYNSLKSPE